MNGDEGQTANDGGGGAKLVKAKKTIALEK
jgi:hypothetical protein